MNVAGGFGQRTLTNLIDYQLKQLALRGHLLSAYLG
jgi:hypothetical protein